MILVEMTMIMVENKNKRKERYDLMCRANAD